MTIDVDQMGSPAMPMGAAALPAARVPIPVGAPVEVRSRFDRRWNPGFAVACCGEDGYQLRRLSDGEVLPAWFPGEMVRTEGPRIERGQLTVSSRTQAR